MKTILNSVRVKSIKNKFKWEVKNPDKVKDIGVFRLGYQVVLELPYFTKDHDKIATHAYSSLHVVVFKPDLLSKIDQYVGTETCLDFTAELKYKKYVSNKYVNKETNEPAELTNWDFTLVEFVGITKSANEELDSLPTLEDILE